MKKANWFKGMAVGMAALIASMGIPSIASATEKNLGGKDARPGVTEHTNLQKAANILRSVACEERIETAPEGYVEGNMAYYMAQMQTGINKDNENGSIKKIEAIVNLANTLDISGKYLTVKDYETKFCDTKDLTEEQKRR